MTDDFFMGETTALILRDFELVAPSEAMSEEAFLNYLSEAIGYLITHKLDFLLSLLYRLDVSEHKINVALSPTNAEPAPIALAKLVLERQKQRVATKQAYRAKNPSNWNWEID